MDDITKSRNHNLSYFKLAFSEKYLKAHFTVLLDTYTVNNSEQHVVQVHTNLGFILNEDLKTTAHSFVITSKSFRSVWSIRRTFNHVGLKIFTTLYTVLIHPKLEYCTEVPIFCLNEQGTVGKGSKNLN